MSCCGNARASIHQQTSRQQSSATVSHQASRANYWAPGPVQFEYSGQGQLSVTGPVTGMVYHFPYPGARVSVHGSDAPSLVSVPALKRAG
jgi:hypothetical protein